MTKTIIYFVVHKMKTGRIIHTMQMILTIKTENILKKKDQIKK